jgi:hypothetical protein
MTRVVPVPIRGPHVPRVAVPAAATDHTIRTLRKMPAVRISDWEEKGKRSWNATMLHWHDIREGGAFTLRLTVTAAFHYGARPGIPPPELLPVPMPFRPAIGQQ